jgi:hypothetical protein
VDVVNALEISSITVSGIKSPLEDAEFSISCVASMIDTGPGAA